MQRGAEAAPLDYFAGVIANERKPYGVTMAWRLDECALAHPRLTIGEAASLSSSLAIRGRVIHPILEDREGGEAVPLHARAQAVRAANEMDDADAPPAIDARRARDDAPILWRRGLAELL